MRRAELKHMLRTGRKAEIEILCSQRSAQQRGEERFALQSHESEDGESEDGVLIGDMISERHIPKVSGPGCAFPQQMETGVRERKSGEGEHVIRRTHPLARYLTAKIAGQISEAKLVARPEHVDVDRQ